MKERKRQEIQTVIEISLRVCDTCVLMQLGSRRLLGHVVLWRLFLLLVPCDGLSVV
jgi:hypothetical protein